VNQVVQGVSKALGPKWLTGKRLRPPAWCGAARALCAGDVETPFPLVEKFLSGGSIKVIKGA
jgi:hypothetical protein